MIPTEYREPRFAVLEMLISRGWGHIPGRLIDKAIRENGGKLPDAPPDIDPGEPTEAPDEFRRWAIKQRLAGVSGRQVIIAAVEAGYSISPEISDATGLNIHRVSAALSALARSGELRVVGEAKGQRTRMFIYGVKG